jgi:DNA-directed RNA polymerase specialized sigma24 family protein
VSDSGPEEGAARPGGETYRTPEEWAAVVEQIRAGDPAGEEVLYATLMGGARFFLRRRTRTDDVDDLVHNLYLTVVAGIRDGQLREPERLMGFVRIILIRQGSAHVKNLARTATPLEREHAGALPHPGPDPERLAMERQKRDVMRRLIRELRPRDEEILRRFYFFEESEERIRAAMNLSENQFRLLKSRAKERFKLLLQERLARRRPTRQ